MLHSIEPYVSFFGWKETVIVILAVTWAIVSVTRQRSGLRLGRRLRQAAWLPIILAILVAIVRAINTQMKIDLLREAQALNEVQRQMLVQDMTGSVLKVLLLGAVLSCGCWVLTRASDGQDPESATAK